MNKAQILLEQAIAVEKAIKEKKLKAFNLPIQHQPFINTIRKWAVGEGETIEQFNNNLGL